jgi:hypothetical protein
MIKINESLEHLDMENKVTPLLSIDEYKSRLGEDSNIITLTFIVSAKKVGEDLVNWLERGYDFIIDAEISPGEVFDKKFLVFAECDRLSSMAFRIVEIVEDLETLTGLKLEDWKVKIGNKKYPLSKEVIEKLVPLSASDYNRANDEELNEMRDLAGLTVNGTYDRDDEALKQMQRQAGIR